MSLFGRLFRKLAPVQNPADSAERAIEGAKRVRDTIQSASPDAFREMQAGAGAVIYGIIGDERMSGSPTEVLDNLEIRWARMSEAEADALYKMLRNAGDIYMAHRNPDINGYTGHSVAAQWIRYTFIARNFAPKNINDELNYVFATQIQSISRECMSLLSAE